MSLVPVRGFDFIPGMMARGTRGVAGRNTILDADGELCGSVFYVPKTGNISKIGIRVGIVTTTDTLKVSIQGIDESNGHNDGVIARSGTLSTPVSNTTYWVELDSPLAVTMGHKKTIAIEWNNWVGEGSDGNLQISYGIRGFGHYGASIPYSFVYTGGAWAFYQACPNFGFEYDDGTIEPTISLFPAVSFTSYSWNMNTNPDRRGSRLQVPFACRAIGAFFIGDIDGNANLILYDSDGTTILKTVAMDKDIRAVTDMGSYFAHFSSPKILTIDTNYRLVLLPTTGTNISLSYLTVTDDGANKAMNAVDGGVEMHGTSCNGPPTQESDWTNEPTIRYIMGLVVDRLGTEDYPDTGEVAEGVKFSDDTLTGTFVRNVVGGATVVGQSTAGIVIGE